MTTGIWVLGDQLWSNAATLTTSHLTKGGGNTSTPVILIESRTYVKQRPYHQQKLVLIWSAMRHFAAELQAAGWNVTYKIADDFASPLQNWIKQKQITQLRVMQPNNRPFTHFITTLQLDCELTFVPNNHFLWQNEEFKQWANGRKRLLLEDFYRESRKKFNILMENGKPVGEKWNFDKQNRKPPKGKLNTPGALWFEPDEITQEVIKEVQSLDFPTYGKAQPFRWGVTRFQALAVLEHFITECLPTFGPYQDAMVTGEETMWHSLISPYLNIGLLTPQEVLAAGEKALKRDNLAINSVEGFIRQVLGWREYLNGLYHYVDEDYFQLNFFEHSQPLPEFFWDSSKTDMNCLQQILRQVENTGYAHHIQRLMVLSNFALIVGIAPGEIENWFHSAFIDAYDWVMQTNVLGMGQFADGGILASKPYAASANYINKMSDYCGDCVYNPGDRTGNKACPFNYFYWDFLARHQEKLKSLGRMNLILANLKRMETAELDEIRQLAHNWNYQGKNS